MDGKFCSTIIYAFPFLLCGHRITFFLVATILIAGILSVIQQYLNIDSKTITLPQLAPALGCLLIHLVYRNQVVHYKLNMTIALKAILILLVSFSLFFIAFITCHRLGLVKILPDYSNKIGLTALASVALGALGEEIGWRSFLQPSFEQKYSWKAASVIVGLIWGLWHIDLYRHGLPYMTGFVTFSVSSSLFISWMARHSKYNLLLSTVFHISINISFIILFNSGEVQSAVMAVIGSVWLIPSIFLFIKAGDENKIRTI